MVNVLPVVPVQSQLLDFTQHQQQFDRDQALVAVMLARLISPGVVAETRHGNSKADQRNGISLDLLFEC